MIEECQLKDIRQFGEGLWFPLEVDRMAMLRSDPGPDAKEDELKGAKMYTLRYALSIDKNADGEPLLRVNHDIPDEKFKGKFAVRTAVYDHVVDTYYLVGTASANNLDQFVLDRIQNGHDANLPFDQFAEQYKDNHAKRTEVADGNVPGKNSIRTPGVVGTGGNNHLAWVAAAAILLGATAVLIVRRRGSSKL